MTPARTSQAKHEIENAASEAVKVIANAASEAAKVVANATAEAAKVVNASNSDDHDLLVELKTKMEDLKSDIKELKDNVAERVKTLEEEKLNTRDSYLVLHRKGVEDHFTDHEIRIRLNEEKLTKIMTYGSALIVVVGIVEFLISKFY